MKCTDGQRLLAIAFDPVRAKHAKRIGFLSADQLFQFVRKVPG